MASYEIAWKRSAEQELRNIDRQFIPRILEAIEALADNPFPSQHRKLHGSVNYASTQHTPLLVILACPGSFFHPRMIRRGEQEGFRTSAE